MKNIFLILTFVFVTLTGFSQSKEPFKGADVVRIDLDSSQSTEEIIDKIINILLDKNMIIDTYDFKYGYVKTDRINGAKYSFIVRNGYVLISSSFKLNTGVEMQTPFVTAKSHLAYKPFNLMISIAKLIGDDISFYQMQ